MKSKIKHAIIITLLSLGCAGSLNQKNNTYTKAVVSYFLLSTEGGLFYFPEIECTDETFLKELQRFNNWGITTCHLCSHDAYIFLYSSDGKIDTIIGNTDCNYFSSQMDKKGRCRKFPRKIRPYLEEFKLQSRELQNKIKKSIN